MKNGVKFIIPQAIVEGQPRLIFAFIAELFNARPCLNETEKDESDDEPNIDSKSENFFIDEETESERYTISLYVADVAPSPIFKQEFQISMIRKHKNRFVKRF